MIPTGEGWTPPQNTICKVLILDCHKSVVRELKEHLLLRRGKHLLMNTTAIGLTRE
jgi:hypothetical protein